MSIRLKVLRKKLGLTLETLAEKTAMTKSYLSKVERGLNTPSIAAALKPITATQTVALTATVGRILAAADDPATLGGATL